MKVKRKSDGAVVYESENGFSLKGWDQESQTYYGNNVKVRRVGQGVPVVTAEDIAKKKEEAKPKTTAAAILSGDGNVGGTFLGGYKVTPQKKREYTAEDYAAALKAAEEAEEREKYLAALDLDAQQEKIDALSATIDNGPKLNIHAFGGYDPKGETEAERELATLRRDYNEAESIQYDMEGARVLDSLDRETRQQVEDYATGSRVEGMNGWAAGKDLLAKGYTKEEINRMADYRRRQINKEKMDKAVQRSIDFANTGAGSEAVGSVWSVPQNLVGGITGSLSLGLQNLQNWISGSDRPVDYNAPAFRGTKKATAFREQVAQNIYQYAETEAKGNVNAFLYQTGMSMADSAAIYGLTLMGVPAAASTTLLSSSAAVNGALEAKERGASDEQALAVGVFSGAAEWVFERISLDSLLKAKPATGTIRQQVTQMLKNAGLQAGVEGSEEVFTSLANSITDALVMGDLSALETSIRDYMAQGMTETDAKKKAYGDFAKQLALDFLGGALSGGIMGGVAGTINEAAMNRAYGELYGESAQELAQEALEINPDSTAAQRVAEKYGEGKKISGGELREVALENQKAIDKAQREAAMAEQERRNAPPTAKVEGKLTLPDGRKISTYTSDEKGNAFWVTDEGTVKGEEQDSSVVGAANKWGGDIGRVIVEQYDGADEATYAAAADIFVELGIQSVDGEMTWDKAAEITGAFVDEVGLEHANALYSAGVSAARNPAFRQYYHAGLIGNEVGSVSVQGKAWLSDAVRQYAYELGQAHAKDEKRHKYTVSKKAGFDSNAEGAKKLNRETRRVLDRIGKTLGVEIRFATAEDHLSDDANGLYDAKTGTIIISPNASNPVMVVVAHEVTHRMQDMDFEAYKQYRSYVIGKMEQRTGTMAVTKLRDRYRAFYGSNSFTDLQAMDELAADYTLAMIEDGNLFRELKEDNRSVARKLWSALKNFISRLTGSQPKGYSLYGTTIEELREAQRMWEKMLNGEKSTQDEGSVWDAIVGTKKAAEDGGVRHSLIEGRVAAAVRDAMDHADVHQDNLIKIGQIPSAITDISDISGDLYIYRNHAYENMVSRKQAEEDGRSANGEHFHALGEEKMIDALVSINEPYLAIAQTSRQGTPALYLVLPQFAEDGVPLSAAINFYVNTPINGKQTVRPHVTVSVYNRPFDGYTDDRGFYHKGLLEIIDEAVKDNKLLINDKKIRADVPVTAKRSSLGSITTSALEENVAQFKREVKEFKEKNKIRYSLKTDSDGRQLTEAQAEFFKDSKVRDYNGNLKVMYHGTKSEFTVFDKSKLRDGFGFFFTDDKREASDYGTPNEYHLNISNPFDMFGDKDIGDFLGGAPRFVDGDFNYAAAVKGLVEAGYDGLYDGMHGTEWYIAFAPEQIKLVSNLNPTDSPDIRYSLKEVSPVEPTSEKWRRGATFDEVKAKHPTLFALDADEAETRNPTQINGTVKTYRKIYQALKNEGFDGTILDASSGLGYGTEAGRKEFGYDVDDIEPFPDAKYKPRYTDYSKLHKKYDYIISNAVLNVMPQDLRDAMVVKIGELLNDGGRAFINVRGTDVKNASSKVAIDDDLMEYFISNTGSYQKGFTVKELKAYLEDALGSGFTVTPSNMGGVSVIVTKDSARFSLKDSEGKALTEEQAAYFAESKSVDAQGRLRVMYRGGTSGFTVFDRKKSSYSNLYGRGFYFTDSKNHAEQYGGARAFYLNITNPVPTDERTITKGQLLAFLQAVAENEDDYSFENYGYGATPESVADAIFSGKSDFAMLYDVSQTAIGDMVEAVELFNAINGTDFDGLILDTETVTFRSEQAKLTTNKTPTDDPDIRFSLKSPVEQTARLIALHNLTEEKLLGDLRLGGLPMPSIAVVLAEAGHAKYGDISLVFGKDTIDPQFMRSNKVYGGDAWTPTFPRVEYDVDDDVVRKARNTIYAAADRTVLDSFGYMGLDSDNMEDGLNRNNGDVAAIYRYKDGMKYAYLAATQQYTPPMKVESLGKYSGHENEVILAVYDALGGDLLNELRNGGYQRYQSDKEMVSRVADIINGAYAKMLGQDDFDMFADLSFSDFDNIIRDAARYADYGNETIGQEVDISAARKEIEQLVDQEAYEQWVRDLFDGVIRKSGIRNERDLFTPSGNRRSFDALHYEVTLENIVKAMRNDIQKGGGAFFGGTEIWGVATKDYGSIEDIRADSGRLGMLSDEEYHDIRDAYSTRLAEIVGEIVDTSAGNRFIAMDNAAEAIVETLRTKKTVAAIDKELRSYSYLNVKSDTAEKALELFRDIQNMPTGYFEAKPQRAVGFDEVLAAVVPDNTGEALLSQLAERGINVLTYKQGDDADRLRAVNSVEDAKFSLKSDAAMGNTLRDMAEAEGATKQAVKAWIRDVHRGKKVSVNYEEAERVAKNLINDYRSSADKYDVMGAVLDLFNYLQNGDGSRNMDEATVQEKANTVAAALLSEELRGSYYTADYVETGNGMELSDLAQDNEELRKFLRETKIVYPKQYVSDLGTETWTAFKEGLKGAQARLSDENNRANVDTLYRDDLSRMWPQYFPDSITGEAAMMQRIAEVSRKVFEREAIRRDNANGEVMTRLTAADVLDRFFNLPQVGKTYISVKNVREKSMQAAQRLQRQMDTRNKQTSRAGIIRRVKALDKKLRDNTEKSHVPDHLRRAVLELCSMFTQNTSVFDRYRLAEIKRQYALLNDSDMAAVYDEDINEMLDELADVLDGRRLSELKTMELLLVGNVVDHFTHLVNNANAAFVAGRRLEVSAMAQQVISKAIIDKPRKTTGLEHTKLAGIVRLLTTGNIKPYYLFQSIGGEMQTLFEDMLAGQDRYGRVMDGAKTFREGVYRKYNAEQWITGKQKLEMTTEHGDKIQLTVEEALSLMALYKRELANQEQEAGHLSKGGIVYQQQMERIVKNSKDKKDILRRADSGAKPISFMDLQEISRWLRENVSAQAEAFVDEMVGYLSTTMAELGNETSMALSGIRKFTEGYYFPYKVASQYLETKPGQQKDTSTFSALRNMGFTKRTVKRANAPIVLRNFMDVWSEHVSQMATYATMAVPQDNLLRVLNYKDVMVDEEDGTNINKSVKVSLENTYGTKTLEYIEQLLRDMNGGVVNDPREQAFGTLVRLYKKNAVGLSLSVAIQQPTAAIRAMALIDPKYFLTAPRRGDYAQLRKYAGVAVIKEMGGFDTNMGYGSAAWLRGREGAGDIANAAISVLPQKMDQLTWMYLWNVVKAETRDKHPALLDNGQETEAFLIEAGKRFSEVVEKTQVYDSVLTRSENMRSKSVITNLAVAFMSEPTVTLNMAVAALRSGDKKQLSRVPAALLLSVIVNSIVKALWTAGRDEDEDETYAEKWLAKFVSYASSDLLPTSYIPIVKELMDILKGYSTAIELYEPIEDLISKYGDVAEKWQDNGIEAVATEETLDFLLALSSLAGIPLDNVKRDIETIVNFCTKMAPVDEATQRDVRNAVLEGLGREPKLSQELRKAWSANRSGNERKRKAALAEIDGIYQDKVDKKVAGGMSLADARKEAKSEMKSSCTRYLKPMYLEASGLEKNEVKSFALRISVGGQQLYADYDFNRYWSE